MGVDFSFIPRPSPEGRAYGSGMADPGAVTSRRHRLTLRSIDAPSVATTITIDADLDPQQRADLHRVLVDPLLEHGSWDEPVAADQLDIGLIPGVTDTAGAQVVHAAGLLGITIREAAVGRLLTLDRVPLGDNEIRRRWANAVIERWSVGRAVNPGFASTDTRTTATEVVDLPEDDRALEAIGTGRGLALDLDELQVIRSHFAGIGRSPTDAELETLAQTWSEHCAHKTFRADVVVHDPDGHPHAVEPLLAQLRRSTADIDAPFVMSAFDGNAGIVQFTPDRSYALKCETHNHPSAIEPFGGANTGVGGVIRDIIGAHHRAIACTDILCFGPPDTADDDLPAGVLHPRRIIAGVVAGIADYGNKIGLPTVAGAVLYDPAYVSNPLVFAGCIGVSPAGRPALTGPHPGDRVVVFGGRTGRDGIRGATFSSMAMDASSGDVAGASVQIGDPIVEKLVSDLLVDGWHLYTAITDCGAGGLSSAIGELADGIGADVELTRVPLKYAGLAPWEIWLSEAQERMVVAVAPEQLDELAELAATHGVDLDDLGHFTGDGRLTVRHGGDPIIDLDTAFLHGGCPRRRLEATLPTPFRGRVPLECPDSEGALLALLGHPNIASKADVIRRYDHEILGSTVVRPLIGAHRDGPADGVVLADPADDHGIAIGIGVNPWYGVLDPERMAWAVVDEAIRNIVVAGGRPTAVALMDNFSWGDPSRHTTLGELVAAVRGCCDAAHHYRAPFVSGKDSLNNEYLATDGSRHAIPPTLVITAVAPVDDVAHVVTPDLKASGNAILLLGRTLEEFGGSHLAMVLRDSTPSAVPAPDAGAADRYWSLHEAIEHGLIESAHDCSEGGLAVALAEMSIAGRLGLDIDLTHVADDTVTAMFSESLGRIVCEVRPEHLSDARELFGDDATIIGHVTSGPRLTIAHGSVPVVDLPIARLVAAFNRQSEQVS
jgi:phosphoribosylformylglycinamidine synthase II